MNMNSVHVDIAFPVLGNIIMRWWKSVHQTTINIEKKKEKPNGISKENKNICLHQSGVSSTGVMLKFKYCQLLLFPFDRFLLEKKQRKDSLSELWAVTKGKKKDFSSLSTHAITSR